MISADVILPTRDTRGWHCVLIQRLRNAGHDIQVVFADARGTRTRSVDAILGIERRLMKPTWSALTARTTVPQSARDDRPCELVIDLSEIGGSNRYGVPTLRVLFDRRADLSAAAAALCRGTVPVIDLQLDGVPVRRAAPMADSRAFVGRGLHDVLARAITVVADFVDRYQSIDRLGADDQSGAQGPRRVPVARLYLTSSLPRLFGRAVQRLMFYGDHWRTGYRFIDGPGAAEKNSLAGAPWIVLPDGGSRFYADPFPFEWEGQYYLFVEELVHSVGKGVISMSRCSPNGRFGTPRPVLEEPFHLSYPQVFARDGQVWMIPEAAAAKRVALYRAKEFPDEWVEHKILVPDREICDATLLDHEGLLWLFAAERDGMGSASDTLVVYFSANLEGPWQPHPMNPVLIDKSAARPGGRFFKVEGRVLLPIQDGTLRYGGDLGIAELLHLDTQRVELSRPIPVEADGHWPYPRIHTLNRYNRLEATDGLARVVRRMAH